MYIAEGNIEALIKWFSKTDCELQLLCLFVAGDLRGADFFRSVIDNKESIDIISGKKIGVFLFHDNLNNYIQIETGPGKGQAVIGERIIEGDRIHGVWVREIESIWSNEVRNNLISRSQSITNELVDFFGLSVQEIPSIILIDKELLEPVVIKTEGEIDVKLLFDFLKELREVVDLLPDENMWNIPMRRAKSILEQQEMNQLNISIDKWDNERKEIFNELYSAVQKVGIDLEDANKLFNEKNIITVWNTIGMNPFGRHKLEQPEFAINFNQKIGLLIDENPGDFIDLCRRLIKITKSIEKNREKIKVHNESLREIKSWTKGRKWQNTFKGKFEEIVSKYERKIKWRSKIRPLKKFGETFLGVTKKSKELLDLNEKLMKLIE